MGVVYLAQHRVMERLVAIKVISRASWTIRGAGAVSPQGSGGGEVGHLNIVKAYDAEQVGDLQLLAMEFVEGHSLANVLIRSGRCRSSTPVITSIRRRWGFSTHSSKAWFTAT